MASQPPAAAISRLLTAKQTRELPALEKRFTDGRALLQELQRRGWLTPFQAQQLAQGRGGDLLVGPYRILDRLGEGAAGHVFKAIHEQNGLLVALKVLKKDVQGDAEVVGRFRREIEAASQVAHPNVVKAYEAGTAAGHLFLAMEYVDGIDLDRLVKRNGPLPAATACHYIRQSAQALQHVHERGLVHRDIKPANLLLCTQEGRPVIKLLDLGLARVLQPKADSATSNLTMIAGNTGTFGTPDYLAPEQAIDLRSADIRADIYSLGCTFFYLLTGQPPFAGTLAEKLLKHHQADPPALDSLRPGLPAGLDAIVQRMLAKRPADRYQTPGDVVRALPAPKASSEAPPRSRKQWLRAAMIALPLVLLGLMGWLLLPPASSDPVAVATPATAKPEAAPLATQPFAKVQPLGGPARTVVLQGQTEVEDALIDFNKPDTPLGSVPRDNQIIKNRDTATVWLIRFAATRSLKTPTDRIEEAKLSFWVWDPHTSGNTKVAVFPVKTMWKEGQATWRQPQDGKTWLGGANFNLAQDVGPPLGYVIVRPDQGGDTADPPIEYTIDITAIAKDWPMASLNKGIALVGIPDRDVDQGVSTRFQVLASEYSQVQYTPRLTLRVQP